MFARHLSSKFLLHSSPFKLVNVSSRMSSSLTSWVQSHLPAIHINDRSEDARSAYYSTFSSNPQITLNHEPISQDDFIKHSLPIIKSGDGPTIEWNDVNEIPANDEKKDEASINLFKIKLSLF